MRPNFHSENGFGLIEALIALLVVSIGMLGVAAMQTSGIKFNHDAYKRTQATTLAYDIIETMRINGSNASSYTSSSPRMPAAEKDGADNDIDCAYGSNAVSDSITCWQVFLRDELPTGSYSITGPTGTDGNTYRLAVLWKDRWIDEGGSVVEDDDIPTDCRQTCNSCPSSGVSCMDWSVEL